MPNNAKINLIGNLTRDPQTRQAGSANVVAFSVAVNTMNRKPDGAYDSNFYDVSVFGKQGEYLMQQLQKGTQVWVNGDLAVAEYTDKEGKPRYALRVTGTDVRVMSRGKNDGAAPANKHKATADQNDNNAMPF